MIRTIRQVSIGAVLGALIGVSLLMLWQRHTGSRDRLSGYRAIRADVLVSQAERTPSPETMLIGDSIAEFVGPTFHCGGTTFNAGITSAKLIDIDEVGSRLARMLRPKRIVVAIGTNDTRWENRESVDAWVARYRRLLTDLGPASIILVPIPAFEANKAISAAFDDRDRAARNAAIARLAAANRVTMVAPFAIETNDGIHPSVRGVQAWRGRVEPVCRSLSA